MNSQINKETKSIKIRKMLTPQSSGTTYEARTWHDADVNTIKSQKTGQNNNLSKHKNKSPGCVL